MRARILVCRSGLIAKVGVSGCSGSVVGLSRYVCSSSGGVGSFLATSISDGGTAEAGVSRVRLRGCDCSRSNLGRTRVVDCCRSSGMVRGVVGGSFRGGLALRTGLNLPSYSADCRRCVFRRSGSKFVSECGLVGPYNSRRCGTLEGMGIWV